MPGPAPTSYGQPMNRTSMSSRGRLGSGSHRGLRPHRLRQLVASVALVGLAGGGLVALAPAAHASTVTVTSTTDGAPGSLRALITASNSGGAHTIDVPPGTYDLTIAPTGPDDNSSGDLNITQPLTIVGTGGAAVTTIVVKMADRAITTQAVTSISGLTVTGGRAPSDEDGGDIYAPDGGNLTLTDSVLTNGQALGGGGLGAQSPLVAERDTFSGNVAQSIPGNGSYGGGLLITTDATIDSSTFSGNKSNGGDGGGVELDDTGSSHLITLTNSTITGNTAEAGPGVTSANGGPSHLVYDTIADNTSTDIGGGVFASAAGSVVTVSNSIVVANAAGSTPSNCASLNSGSIVSGGGNLSSDSSCSSVFTKGTDANSNSHADLGALADNGGSTQTMLPGAGSSAIDTAPCLTTPTVDQRGWPRPYGAGCDKGSVEVQPAPITTTTGGSGGSGGSTGSGGSGGTGDGSDSGGVAPAAQAVETTPAFTG